MNLRVIRNGVTVSTCTTAKWRVMASKLDWPLLQTGDRLQVKAGQRVIVDAHIGPAHHTSRVDNGQQRGVFTVLSTIRLFVSTSVRRGLLTRRLTIRPKQPCFN